MAKVHISHLEGWRPDDLSRGAVAPHSVSSSKFEARTKSVDRNRGTSRHPKFSRAVHDFEEA